jgi:hypothetical protein
MANLLDTIERPRVGRFVCYLVEKSAAIGLARRMSYQPATLSDDLSSLPQLPAWVTSMRAEALEDVAFLSEVALSHLHVVVESDALPHALLLDRLVLRAAEACVASSGRGERAGELRCPKRLCRHS